LLPAIWKTEMPANQPDDALERLLESTLYDLPVRRAPTTLESRVFGELERRAALPWWRRSFAHWPLPARASFPSLQESGALPVSGARAAAVLLASAGNLATLLARTVPPTLVYAGIAVCAVLYAVLFGLGATLYRTLYLQPQNGR
jgi:hypothetical protein